MAQRPVTSPWPGAVPSTKDNFDNDGAKTILLIEHVNSGINWMEPRDLTIDNVRRGIGRVEGRKIGCPHLFDAGWLHPTRMIAMAAFVDGRVHYLPEDTPPKVLIEMLSPQAKKA